MSQHTMRTLDTSQMALVGQADPSTWEEGLRLLEHKGVFYGVSGLIPALDNKKPVVHREVGRAQSWGWQQENADYSGTSPPRPTASRVHRPSGHPFPYRHFCRLSTMRSYPGLNECGALSALLILQNLLPAPPQLLQTTKATLLCTLISSQTLLFQLLLGDHTHLFWAWRISAQFDPIFARSLTLIRPP